MTNKAILGLEFFDGWQELFELNNEKYNQPLLNDGLDISSFPEIPTEMPGIAVVIVPPALTPEPANEFEVKQTEALAIAANAWIIFIMEILATPGIDTLVLSYTAFIGDKDSFHEEDDVHDPTTLDEHHEEGANDILKVIVDTNRDKTALPTHQIDDIHKYMQFPLDNANIEEIILDEHEESNEEPMYLHFKWAQKSSSQYNSYLTTFADSHEYLESDMFMPISWHNGPVWIDDKFTKF